MELQSEVAYVASQLGFIPKLHFNNSTAVHPTPNTIRDDTNTFESKRSANKKTTKKQQPSQKTNEKRTIRKTSRKKATKTDSYDKKALLEILSGPDESTKAKMKELRRAKSILPKTISPLWHKALANLPSLEGHFHASLSHKQVEERKQLALKILQNEKDAFEYRMFSSKKKGKWLVQVRTEGTHVDRIAAFSLLIRDSVVANVHELDFLLSVAEKQKGSRDLVINALKALAELFRCFLLPDRKLTFFEQRPLEALNTDQDNGQVCLLFWYLEDCIKRKYSRFLTALASATMAPLEHLRSASVTLVSDLIYDKPEQEAQLLSMLIHKLGDKSRKIGSKVAFLVSKLLTKHPRMKSVVFNEAEKFVYASGTTIRGIRCVLQTFNSIVFEGTDTDRETATRYIDMCFTLFQQMVNGKIGSITDLKKKVDDKSLTASVKKRKQLKRSQYKNAAAMKQCTAREVDATVFSSIIAGIRRSLPFADDSKLIRLLDKHLQALFRMVHVAPFGVSVQIIALLCQILPTKATSLDRLYRAMYEKILDPRLSESRRLPLLISTLFKAIKDDPSLSRATAFVKRLLQVASNSEPKLYCAFLLVVSEVIKFKPGLKSGIVQPEDRSHVHAVDNSEHQNAQKGRFQADIYRIDHREPLYSSAGSSCLWELCLSLHHYHPVAHSIGQALLNEEPVVSRGDPLQELSLSAFLDKFVNGKDAKMKTVFDGRIPWTPGTTAQPRFIGTETFASLATKDVPVEDVFFHKYYNLQTVKSAREARKALQRKRKLKQSKRQALRTQHEDPSHLNDDEDDLESMESLDVDAVDDLAAHDIHEMFAQSGSDPNQPTELIDYSELLDDIQAAKDVTSDATNSDDTVSDLDLSNCDDASCEDVDGLEAKEFPELPSDSEEDLSDEPSSKKRKRQSSKKHLSKDFTPAENVAAVLDSD